MATVSATQVFLIFVEQYLRAMFFVLPILGLSYFIFSFLKTSVHLRHRVPSPVISNFRPRLEFLLTLRTYLVTASKGTIIVLIASVGSHSMMYTRVADYGWTYTLLSVPLFLLYTDTLQYWSHRWLHKNNWGRKVHSVHHSFIDTSPWAGYALHSIEAILQATINLSFLLIFPWHPVAISVFSIIVIFYNGFIHCGYDPIPYTWRTSPFFKWLNTPTHHMNHHHEGEHNFGFLFTFWDKWMKTEKLRVLTKSHAESRQSASSEIKSIQNM